MCHRILIIFACLWIFELGSCGRCPSTWLEMPNGTSCYKLWPNAKKTWDDAGFTCQLLNSNLLKLNSKEEKDWIIGELKKFPPNLEWWIGLKRHGADEEKWVWIDGETRNDSNKFIQWGSGEPNNHLKSEDCAEIWDSLLNDKNCITPLQFICEQPIDTPRPCSKEEGWEDIYPGKNCYKVFNTEMSADNALQTCTQNNATLLQTTDYKEQFIFSDFVTESNNSYWIDLKAKRGYDGSYEWTWTTPGQIDIDLSYWGKKQYDYDWNSLSINKTFCVRLKPNFKADERYKTWEPANCDKQNRFICEKIPITCPATYYKFTLFKCLKPMLSDAQLTWNEARGYCNLRGTSILEVHSQYEVDELNRVMAQILSDDSLRSTQFWLGLAVDGMDRTWDSGVAVSDLVWKLLEEGGATNVTTGCAYIQMIDGSLQLKVGSCIEYRVAVCTVPGNNDVIEPSPLKPKYVCPDQYEVIDDSCIRQHYGDPMDWFSARMVCDKGGAELATIHSLEKLNFLKAKAKGSMMWIGLNDLGKEGKLMWSNEYTEYDGEMNDSLVVSNFTFDKYSENCFALTAEGKLIDLPCNFKKPFFCQIWAEWNIALGKIATQSSIYRDRKSNSFPASMAIDGCSKSSFSHGCCTHTNNDLTPWWELDLGTIYPIRKVIIHRRMEEGCKACKSRMHDFRLFISNVSQTSVDPVFQDTRPEPPMKIVLKLPEIKYGRYVRIDVPSSNKPLTLCEVEVFSEDLNRPKSQKVLKETSSNCFKDAQKWNGKINHGISGRLCQAWVLDTPHKHTRHKDRAFSDGSQRAAKNYCRDPDGEGRPWCYTVDPNVRWEYCPVPHCDTKIEENGQDEHIKEIFAQISKQEIVSDCGGSGWMEDSTGVCYIIKGQYSVVDGQTYCQAWGGDLAIPQNMDVLKTIQDFVHYNATLDNFVWMGVSYTTDGSWQTVDNSYINETFASTMINKNNILIHASQSTACIGIDLSSHDVTKNKWRTDNCLNRHHFICRKNSKNFLYFTPNSQEVLVTNDPDFKISQKSSVVFEFKGESGARIILKNTAVLSQKPVVIEIGSDNNIQSTLMIKFRAVNGFSAPISKVRYHKFWVSWMEGNIQVGEGDIVGDSVFLEGKLSGFVGFDYMSLSVTGNNEGYWKFPREGYQASGERNLALKKKTWQSSTYADIASSDKAVDGCSKNRYDSECCIRTTRENRPWWEVDLGAIYNIREIVMTKRWDCEVCRPGMNKFYVHINNTKISAAQIGDDTISYSRSDRDALPVVTLKTPGARGRFVLIELPGEGDLEFCEIEIYKDTDATHCMPGWLSYDSQTCMYIGTDKVSWAMARSQCKTKDSESDLAVISSSDQDMFIFENAATLLPQSEQYRFWFGLKAYDNRNILWWDGSVTNYSRVNGPGLHSTRSSSLGGQQVLDCSLHFPNNQHISYIVEWKKDGLELPVFLQHVGYPPNVHPQFRGRVRLVNGISLEISHIKESDKGWYECKVIYLDGVENEKKDSNGTWIYLNVHNENIEGQQKCFMTSYDDVDYDGWTKVQCNMELYYVCSKTKVEVPTTTVMTTLPTTQTTTTVRTTTIILQTNMTSNPTQQGTSPTVMTTAPAIGSCPDDWTINPSTSSCLYLNLTRQIDFLAAELVCLKMQSRLASITSKEEEQFFFGYLFDHVKDVGAYKGVWDGFWMGGIDVQEEGSWKWFLYDEPWYSVTWSPGQPSNYGGNEDCMTIRANLAHLNEINDVPCSNKDKEGFICKKYGQPDNYGRNEDCMTIRANLAHLNELNDAPCNHKGQNGFICKKYVNQGICDAGWYYDARTDFCYLVQYDMKTWSQARAVCRGSYGSDLASVVSNKEQEFISVIVSGKRPNSVMYWVGAKTDPQDDTWWWSDKSTWWMRIAWDDFEADISKGCGAVKGTKSLTDVAVLTNQNCEEKLPFVCKKKAQRPGIGVTEASSRPSRPVTTTTTTTSTRAINPTSVQSATPYVDKECGDGWEKRPNSRFCYKFGVDVQTWTRAQEICNRTGGKLLSITSDEEQHYIAGRLNGMPELPLQMWIGANDRQTEGKWTWTDDSPFNYFNWKPMEPNDFDNGEDCASIITAKAVSFGENFGLWNDIGCDTQQGYICKKRAVDLTTTLPPPTSTRPGNVTYGCRGRDWLEYGDDCYLFVEEPTTWKVASTECRLHGGDLASISDELEQEFVFSQLPHDIYCFNIWQNNTECSVWAQRGECTRNPIWMATQCHEACKLCKHNCRDKYESSEKCMNWANQAECDLNPVWMRENCADSCGICRGAPTRGFWIGLYSGKRSNQYEWSDDSRVSYTNWDYTVKQPRYFSYVGGSCGAMFLQTGTWNDGPCDETLQGYVCKTRKAPVSTTVTSLFKTGCSGENTYGYEAYCYTYVREQKTFVDAQLYCVNNGGHLAYIQDRYVQSFVSSELVNKLQDYWIGIKFEQQSLKWADNRDASNLKYINFVKTFDLLRGNDSCFAMMTYRPVGLWKDHNCTEKLPFICQSLREGYTTPVSTTITTTQDIPCANSWISYKGYCYYFPDETATWYEAKQYCATFFSYMLTVENADENEFIAQNMLEITWLGLNDMGLEGTFTWVDGKPFVYQNWDDDEPNNAGNEDCASFNWNGKWNDLPCDRNRHYACKVPKGKQITTTTTSTVSTTPRSTTANLCDDEEGWVFYEGYCYHLFGRTNWHEAKQTCLDHHANLVSVHSTQEQQHVNEIMKDTDDVVWSGLNDLDVDGVFKWSDGTAISYTNWYPGQPNNGGGGEKCVAMYNQHEGRWHDYPCRDDKYALCKRPQGTPSTASTPVPTPRPGGCPFEFKAFGDKCYFIGGKDGNSLKTWAEAQASCVSKKASLTSIHSPAENAFIASLLYDANVKGFWIGFNDLMRKNGQFDWSDNSQVDFSSWAENEPSSNDYYYYERELCVELYGKDDVGHWNDAQCESQKGYVCSMYKDEVYPVPHPHECRDRYRLYQGHCYKGLPGPSSWDALQAQCGKDGSHLATIGSLYEKAFLESVTDASKGPVWVGMKLHIFGEDHWVNGEPQTLPDLRNVLSNNSVGCLSLEVDTGSWIIQNCHTSQYGICEYSSVITTPQTTPYEEKICSNRDLFLYDGYCYLVSTVASTFESANAMCKLKNMTFVSIHSYRENNELINMVNETALKNMLQVRQFYIGMYYEPSRDKIPKWIDKSPVSYLRITPEFYEIDRRVFDRPVCFVFDTNRKAFDWIMAPCDQSFGYICKMKADAPQTTAPTTTPTTTTSTTPTTTITTTQSTTTTTTMTTSTVTTETTPTTLIYKHRPRNRPIRLLRKDDSLSPGQIAAIVVGSLAFILVVIVVVYVIRSGYMRRYLYKVQNTQSLGFDNALFHKGEDSQRESVNFD